MVRKCKSYSRSRAEPRSNQKTGERGGSQGLTHRLHFPPWEFWNSVRQRTGQSTFLIGRQGVSGCKGIPSVVLLLATSYPIRVIFVPSLLLYIQNVSRTRSRNQKKTLTVLTLSYFSKLIRIIHTFMTCTLSMFYIQKMQKNSKWNVLVMVVCMIRIILEKLAQNSEWYYADFRPVRRPSSS